VGATRGEPAERVRRATDEGRTDRAGNDRLARGGIGIAGQGRERATFGDGDRERPPRAVARFGEADPRTVAGERERVSITPAPLEPDVDDREHVATSTRQDERLGQLHGPDLAALPAKPARARDRVPIEPLDGPRDDAAGDLSQRTYRSPAGT